MIICPKCKKELKDGSKFCDACGAKITDTIFCPNCGNKTSKESAFCEHCGTAIKKNVTAETKAEEKSQNKEKRNFDKLPKRFRFGAIAIVVVLLIVFVGKQFVGGGNQEYCLYLKDGQMVYDDYSKDGDYKLTSHLTDEVSASYFGPDQGYIVSRFVSFSENGKYVFYPDKYDEDVLNWDIRDYDGDGAEELLVLVLKNNEYMDRSDTQLNGVSIQMYECESGDIVEKDEYLCMYPVLGYGDLEADNIFLKKINNKIYICGSSDSLTCIYANGSTFTSFIVLYENGEFLKVAGEEKPVQGSGFGLYPNALVIADEMEKIGMTKSAEKVRKTHIPVFDQEDAVDKMLLKITGKNDGLDMKEWNKSRDVSALGKLILKLQVSGFEKNEKIAIVDSQELLKPMENEVSNMSEPEDNKIALTKDDVMRIVSAHYNEQLTDGGYYIIYNAEGIETETGFNFPLHYQLSEEEAQKIVDEGGTPSANRLVGYLDINTESGMVTPDFDEPWILYD